MGNKKGTERGNDLGVVEDYVLDDLSTALSHLSTVSKSLQYSAIDSTDVSELLNHREHLQSTLYAHWYCACPKKVAAGWLDLDLTERFRAAHAGTRQWESGWIVKSVSSRGRLRIKSGREQRVVNSIDCIDAFQPGVPPKKGSNVTVVQRRDSETINPGDWVTFSAAWPTANNRQLLRLYWNISPEAAPTLVRQLTSQLPQSAPYFLKIPRKPSEFNRSDAAVLYIPATSFTSVVPVIKSAYQSVESTIFPDTPALTRPLCPGLSIAEDPVSPDESFGMHRCRLLVDAYFSQLQRTDAVSDNEWIRSVFERFTTDGIPHQRPYVNTYHSPEYSLQ